jgi:hypothetical protein
MPAGAGAVRATGAASARVAARLGLLMTALATLLAAGCGHLSPHWPWHHAPPSAAPVHELDISGAPGGASPGGTYPQYWKRNTLVVDLSAVSGSGRITLRPAGANGWPVRLALRITPGSIAELDVRGAQRLILPITPSGGKPVDLELAPGVYTRSTPQLTVSWGSGPPQS